MPAIFFLTILVNINLSHSLNIKNQFGISNEYLGSTRKHLFYFVHITDIHITHYGSVDRIKQFEEFCNEIIVNLIKPKVTIVSGDLVDSANTFNEKIHQIFGTAQYEEEWKIYRDILTRTNVTKYTKWLDIRGNHDTFMNSDPDSIKDFYRVYSNQGYNHTNSYEYTLKTDENDVYSFVGLDLCPRPGLGRPFNFFGHLTDKEQKHLLKLSEKTRNSTATVFFGHYPLSFTYSKGIDSIMSHGIVYLNGHLHIGVKHYYTLHSNGLLEIELGDWKRKRRFRLVTIDSGLISFEDYRFNASIFAVLSNPKPSKFRTPREPLHLLSQSSHIRILIFSRAPIKNVTISIDNQYIGSASRSVDNQNLYILPWNTSIYNDENDHQILIYITDTLNHQLIVEHEFSLSASIKNAINKSKFMLAVHQPTFYLALICASLSTYILILLVYRYRAKYKRFYINNQFSIWNQLHFGMVLLCSNDTIYFALLFFSIYQFIGPWYLGFLTDGHFGVAFLWGILIKGMYLLPDMQLFFGLFQVLFFLFPYTITLSSSCYYRYLQLQSNQLQVKCRCFQIYTVYVLFFNCLCFASLSSLVVTASFKISFIISPFGLPLTIFSIIFYMKSRRLKVVDFKVKLFNKSNANVDRTDDGVNSKLILHIDESPIVLNTMK